MLYYHSMKIKEVSMISKEREIPTGEIREILSYNQRYILAAIALILFFCGDAMDSFFARIIPDFAEKWQFIFGIENLIIGIPAFICCFFTRRSTKYRVWPYYLLVAILVGTTWLFHPEYGSWFEHPSYGVYNQFLILRRGIYALLMISLFYDEKKLLNCIMLAAKLSFVFYFLQFCMAQIRGYWANVDYLGETANLEYNLMFGYNMAFCAVVFLCLFFYIKKVRYLLMFGVATATIVLDGSRGSLACIAGIVPILLIVNWRGLLKRSLKVVFCSIMLAAAVILITVQWDSVVKFLLEVLDGLNIQSRTIEMFLTGEILEDNGRNEITQMAVDLIKSGGWFGHGVYGDRYVIGQKIYWGYSHNVFLELFVSFGYVGAIIIIGFLFYRIFKMILLCQEKEWKLMLSIFLSGFTRLLFSDSFWYSTFFWGILGITGVWNLKYKSGKEEKFNE